MKKILVPTDFSIAAGNAIKHAAQLASKGNFTVVLLHIQNSHTAGFLRERGKELHELESYLAELAQSTTNEWGVGCEFKIREGSIMIDINAEAAHAEYVLVVLGAHGAKGIRQALFGPDLLKIARKCPVPILAVPQEAALSKRGYGIIVFPYGGHAISSTKLEASVLVAGLNQAEIQLYTIDRFTANMTTEMLHSIKAASDYIEIHGIKQKLVNDEMTGFSVGFSNRTLQYAKEMKAEVIAIMSTDSSEFSSISSADKENLINNNEGICILLTADI